MLQVVAFPLKDLKHVLHTFLSVNVAFNCGAAHGLENATGCRMLRQGQDRHLQLREEASQMHINGTF